MESRDMIGATVAVYPLHGHSTDAVRRAIHSIESSGIDADVGTMSTMVTGTVEEIFGVLRGAYEAAAATGRQPEAPRSSGQCTGLRPRGRR